MRHQLSLSCCLSHPSKLRFTVSLRLKANSKLCFALTTNTLKLQECVGNTISLRTFSGTIHYTYKTHHCKISQHAYTGFDGHIFSSTMMPCVYTIVTLCLWHHSLNFPLVLRMYEQYEDTFMVYGEGSCGNTAHNPLRYSLRVQAISFRLHVPMPSHCTYNTMIAY